MAEIDINYRYLKLKERIFDYIKQKEAEFYKIGEDSLMHYSAHDIFLIFQEINEHIKTL